MDDKELRIGVTGYSAQKFDTREATRIISDVYNIINEEYSDRNKTVVSGLTDLGIPAIAYREAQSRGWRTVGIACSRAKEYPCFPVDKVIIEGEEWGQESETFLNNIDILVRIGGGKQAHSEAESFKRLEKRVIEHDLQAIN